MTIVVSPHNPQEEEALLAFLDNMRFDYNSREEDTFVLSEAQQKEILERDREYEAGETETFSINEIIAHFNIKRNNVPIAGSSQSEGRHAKISRLAYLPVIKKIMENNLE